MRGDSFGTVPTPKVFRSREVDDDDMTYSAVYPAPPRRATALPVAVLIVVCLVGGLVAMNLALKGPSVSLAPSQKMPGIADLVRTSFGFVEVEDVAATASPLADVAHTIDVRLAVALTNKAALPLLFSSSQFELVDSNGRVIPSSDDASVPATLAPNSSIGMSLHFLTSADLRPFVVRFVDKATQRVLDISIGSLDCVGVPSCQAVTR